jgi:hypothetical protein
MRPTLGPHLWNEPSGICALCGESRGRLQSPDHPTGQWWCWDNTYGDVLDEPERSEQL